jgi:hypothetical protein
MPRKHGVTRRSAWIAFACASLALFWVRGATASTAGLLTPATGRELQVTMDADFTTNLPFADVVRPSVDRKRSQRLTALAGASGFDVEKRIAGALPSAFASRGVPVDEVEITRARSGPRPVARDELPYPATHSAYLDVAVDNVWLVARTHASPYRPAVRITFRIVDAKGSVVQPARSYIANHIQAVLSQDASTSGAGFVHAKRVEIPSDPGCEFDSFDDATRDPVRLWACYGSVFQIVATELAGDAVPALQRRRWSEVAIVR